MADEEGWVYPVGHRSDWKRLYGSTKSSKLLKKRMILRKWAHTLTGSFRQTTAEAAVALQMRLGSEEDGRVKVNGLSTGCVSLH